MYAFMYTGRIFYLWRVRMEIFLRFFFFFLRLTIFFLRRQFTPTPPTRGFLFCSDGTLRKGNFCGRVCVGGESRVDFRAHRFFSAFSSLDYIGEIFICLIPKQGDVCTRCMYIFVWRQKYVNHLMISTHCLAPKGEAYVWMGGRDMERGWDVFPLLDLLTGYFVALWRHK